MRCMVRKGRNSGSNGRLSLAAWPEALTTRHENSSSGPGTSCVQETHATANLYNGFNETREGRAPTRTAQGQHAVVEKHSGPAVRLIRPGSRKRIRVQKDTKSKNWHSMGRTYRLVGEMTLKELRGGEEPSQRRRRRRRRRRRDGPRRERLNRVAMEAVWFIDESNRLSVEVGPFWGQGPINTTSVSLRSTAFRFVVFAVTAASFLKLGRRHLGGYF